MICNLLKSHFGIGFLLEICCLFSEHLLTRAPMDVYLCMKLWFELHSIAYRSIYLPVIYRRVALKGLVKSPIKNPGRESFPNKVVNFSHKCFYGCLLKFFRKSIFQNTSWWLPLWLVDLFTVTGKVSVLTNLPHPSSID